jgi:hypothetical protein
MGATEMLSILMMKPCAAAQKEKGEQSLQSFLWSD